MAARARPGRTLVVFFLALGVMFALVALAGSWTPKLGLDLQGGTRITLIATGDQVTEQSLTEAATIIDNRVNGSGVSEAEVTTQGTRFVVVEIPGESRRDLVDTVKRQAQMRFRVVATTAAGTATGTGAGTGATGVPTPSPDTGPVAPSASPDTGPLAPSASPSGSGNPSRGSSSPKATPRRNPSGSGAGDREGVSRGAVDRRASSTSAAQPSAAQPSAAQPSAAQPATGADGARSAGPADRSATRSPEPTPTPSPSASPDQSTAGPSINQPLAWAKDPDAKSLAAFRRFSCPPPGEALVVDDDPDKPLVTCDDNGVKYLLSIAMIEGTDLDSAQAGIPQNDVQWVVSLDFNGPATDEFAKISRDLFGTERQFAIVLDGQVISAPTMNGLITNGQAEISGNFSQAEAQSLATSLQFGALPIRFEKDPPVETVGPSLAGDQLSAGITAGAFGLALVMLYCLLYYRGLGIVVIASLVVAAAATYALVLLLSETAGFTLSLPGIAGLIVAVGITADSFIVFFERIRDEMRDGKSMRVAVESGWVRARNTCLAADSVSLLAAVVLYIFAAGVVKGFAFALGLSTLVDLMVFFWFTKPMVSWLARFDFFGKGHRLSGLDAGNLGIERPATAGVRR